ncbi:hypothetical protein OROGR_032836 [Orobanche gracilis]
MVRSMVLVWAMKNVEIWAQEMAIAMVDGCPYRDDSDEGFEFFYLCDCAEFPAVILGGDVIQAVQQIYRYVDDVVEQSANEIRRHIDETRVAHTESILTGDVDSASSPIDQIEGVPSPSRASVPVEHTLSLDHQSAVPTVTPCYSFSPSLNRQSSVPTVTPGYSC